MTITKERCIELALQWADVASKERSGFGCKTAAASATIALTYATLAGVVSSKDETS